METGDSRTLQELAALDRRLVSAAKPIRLLASVSWSSTTQADFLRRRWRAGGVQLPEPDYVRLDYSGTRDEIEAVQAAAHTYGDHPVADYIWRTAESLDVSTQLLDALGTAAVTEHSIRLFGKPGDVLPGSELHNIEAAQHFISLADELSHELSTQEADYCLSAEVLQRELQEKINSFFVFHQVRVELDPKLMAKAAAGPTRIRLRSGTAFSEYDRHQLLEHEAFVHSLTALNGREQPHLKSLALNSPRITATQEGLATFAELITGSIDIGRMKRISMRIIAIDMALRGADFIEVFRYFLDSGQTDTDSFTSAQRVFRGVPLTGGSAFTKDTVYLHGLLSVHTFFRWALKNSRLKLIRHLFAGKLTLHDVIALEPYFDSGWLKPALYLPHWVTRANGLAGMLAFSLFANRIRLEKVQEDDLVLGL